MRRRRFLRTTGTLSLGWATLAAGCAGDGDGDGTERPPTDTERDTPTPTPTPTATPEPEPQLSIVDTDETTDLAERGAILIEVSVKNDGRETTTGVIRAEYELDSMDVDAARQVTVPPGETVDVPLKPARGDGYIYMTYAGDVSIEEQFLGEPSEPLDRDPAEDVLITEVDSGSGDEPNTTDVTVTTRRFVDAARTVTLVGEVDIDDGEKFRGRNEVELAGDRVQPATVQVEYEYEGGSMILYHDAAWLE